MTDIVITAANVVAGTGAVTERGTAGETILAGQVVYKAAATSKYMKADSNSATAEVKVPRGIALNGASLNQPLAIIKSGALTAGGTLVPGATYYLSETPGGIQPAADVATEDVALLGLAASASVLNLDIQVPGVTVA